MDVDVTRRNKKPRPLSEAEKERMDEFVDSIHYSARYAIFLDPMTRFISFFSSPRNACSVVAASLSMVITKSPFQSYDNQSQALCRV